MNFTDYITDADFENYIKFKTTEPEKQGVEWYIIVIPIIIALLMMGSIVFCVVAHKRRKVFAVKE